MGLKIDVISPESSKFMSLILRFHSSCSVRCSSPMYYVYSLSAETTKKSLQGSIGSQKSCDFTPRPPCYLSNASLIFPTICSFEEPMKSSLLVCYPFIFCCVSQVTPSLDALLILWTSSALCPPLLNQIESNIRLQ